MKLRIRLRGVTSSGTPYYDVWVKKRWFWKKLTNGWSLLFSGDVQRMIRDLETTHGGPISAEWQ